MSLLRFLPFLLLSVLAGCAVWPTTPDAHAPSTVASAPQQDVVLKKADAVDLWVPRPAWHLASEWDTQPTWATESARVAARTSRSTVDLTRPPRDVWERIRRGFAIPNLHGELTDHWTNYYAAHPELMQRMTQRAGKFLYHVVDALEQRGLPTELALLPFVESAYNPTALSRASASGLWQFMPATGRQYQLTQDWWRDERRDPVASTQAALTYLSYLYEFQGDWHLALASYNWGEGAVRRAMERNKQADEPTHYTALKLPDETRNYVPKLQAIKNLIATPEKYGLTLPHVPDLPYFVTVQKTHTLDVAVAAKLAGLSVEEFKALNPAHERPVMLGEHQPTLLLPVDRVETFQENLANYQGQLSSWKTYRAKRGESYADIAKRHDITLAQLREINGLNETQIEASAQTLLVPVGNLQLAALGAAHASGRVRTYVVKKGDTLSVIAKNYGTSVRALQQLNGLKDTRIKPGRRLQLPRPDRRG